MQSLKVLSLVMLVVCPNAAQAQQKVVFLRLEEFLPGESSDGDPANAWVSNLDGSNQVKITSSRWVSHARWLNEKTVAVISEGDIWLVPLDGRAKTRLTKGEHVRSLDCSIDGQMIFFTKGSPDIIGSLIFQMDRNGKNRRKLAETGESFMPLVAASHDSLFFIDTSNNMSRVRSFSFLDEKEEIVFQAQEEFNNIYSLACDEKGEHIAFSLVCHEPELAVRMVIVDIENGRSSGLCRIDSGGCYGCSFISDSELIFNDGNRLFRMKLDKKKGKYSEQKVKTSITDVLDPDVY